MTEKKRCFGNKPGAKLYAHYHDWEWGVPLYDDTLLFEMLVLEGSQAGLTWETILKRREKYKQAFKGFKVNLVAAMTDQELDNLLNNSEIIRNRLKVYSARQNAIAFIKIQKEFGSFNKYLWQFVNNKPIKNHWVNLKDVPTETTESQALSKSLKQYGFSFVGPTIVYAYMQAVGLVNDHLTSCWRYKG